MRVTALLATIAGCAPLVLPAQGPLTPPGPPAPSMKTLEQVEPRILISQLPFSIRRPGSYYLAADLAGVASRDGITVDADDVTIDLNGFTLRGVASSRSGIMLLDTRSNLTIRNGVICDWGGDGVTGVLTSNSQFLDLRVDGNTGNGLHIADGCQVRRCLFNGSGGSGLRIGVECQILDVVCRGNGLGIVAGNACSITGCTVTGSSAGNGIETGESGLVLRCAAIGSNLHGFVLGNGSQAIECTASGNTQIGIAVSNSGTVTNCDSFSNSTDGIQLGNGSVARGNTCQNNGVAFFGAGIRVTGSNNRVEDNHLSGADRGLWVTGTGNRVAGNTVSGNSENYVISAENHLNLLLSEIPVTISWPAVVELGGTLTGVPGQNGITIASSEVTIDLKGHSLVGVAGSLDGIQIQNASPDRTNVTIRNGAVKDWGQDGVDATDCEVGSVQGIKASGNGGNGISIGSGGITSGARRALLVADCQSMGNTMNGIIAHTQVTVQRCVATHNTLSGIQIAASCLVKDCIASRNESHGIYAQNDNRIVGNTCDDNTLDGIHIFSGDTRVDGNCVTDNEGAGINASGAGALIIRNTAAGNGTSYLFAPNNRHGPIVDVVSVDGDISATPGADHPWANFEF